MVGVVVVSILQCAYLHRHLLPGGRVPSAHLPWSVTDLSFHGGLPAVSALVPFK